MQKGSTFNEEEILDPENIIYDDEGNVAGVFDPESGEKKMYENPEGGEDKNLEKPEGDDTIIDPEKSGSKDPEKSNETPEYANHADFILKEGGYDLDEIEFEDGRKVKIADLTSDDQLNIVTNEFQRMRDEFQAEIENSGQAKFENEEEEELINFLRSGGTAKDLAKFIIESDPDNAHKALTDDDLVFENLKTQYPGASEEDIEEEFKVLKDAGRVEKRAMYLRNKLASGEIKFSDISAKHKEQVEAQKAVSLRQDIYEATKIVEYAKTVKEIAGIPIDGGVTATIIKDLVPDNLEEDSEFLKTLNEPEKLVRLRFLDLHAEKVFQHISDQAFKDGMETERERLEGEISELRSQLNIKDAHLRKFSDQPLVKFSNTKNTNNRKDQRREEEETF